MKILLHIALVVLLTGCASSFRPVYLSSEGDYYLEESSAVGSYYGSDSVLYANVGFNSWWVNPYNPLDFVYHSPYFYPHYFSVWYPPVNSRYYRYYGYNRGYYPSWCPPYAVNRTHQSRSVLLPVADGRALVSRRDIWRTQDNQSLNRMVKSKNQTTYKSFESTRGMTTIKSAPAKPATSFSSMGFSRPSGSSRVSSRANSPSRSYAKSAGSARRNNQ
jgi:hypothetical protein